MMGTSSPISLRIRRTTSTPFISGISQSIMYTWNGSFCSVAYFALKTASFPEVVHSGRNPIVRNIFSTLTQLSILSSATSARKPFNSWITPRFFVAEVVLKRKPIVISEPFPSSLFTFIFPPIISTIFSSRLPLPHR